MPYLIKENIVKKEYKIKKKGFLMYLELDIVFQTDHKTDHKDIKFTIAQYKNFISVRDCITYFA